MSVAVAAAAAGTLSGETTQSRRLATFSVLAAIAVIGWHAQNRPQFQVDWTTAGFLLALVVLVRPFSRLAFFCLAVAETLSVLIALPSTNTNRLLQLFVFGTIASTAIYAFVRNGLRRLDGGAWLELFQPLLRLELVIVYALAAWHKLNFDFFNPQLSCAVVLYERTPFLHPHAAVDMVRWGLILGTVITEASLPVLLSLRKTRNFAVCYGVLFHVGLGISEFYAFSITMISLLFLFTPDNFCDIVLEFWQSRSRPSKRALVTGLIVIVIVIVAWNVFAFGPSLSDWRRVHSFQAAVNMVWGRVSYWSGYWLLPLYLAPVALFVFLWHEQPDAFRPSLHSYRPIPVIFWLIPAVLIFDGINPYLGLKTDTAFAMYSNLRSEGGTTNHLIWRHPLDLGHYQEDLVQIVDSNDRPLKIAAERGMPMPFFDLRRRVSYLAQHGTKNISVTYTRNGQTIRLANAESDPELSRRPSLLERKLLLFRVITREGCPH